MPAHVGDLEGERLLAFHKPVRLDQHARRRSHRAHEQRDPQPSEALAGLGPRGRLLGSRRLRLDCLNPGGPCGRRRPRHRLQHELAVTGLAANRSAGLAEEEACPRRLKAGGAQHQGDLPGLGEEAVVDLQIRRGQEDLAAGVRVIPAHRLQPAQGAVAGRRLDRLPQPGLVVLREHKAGAEGVLAGHRPEGGDADQAAFVRAEQHAADLDSSASQTVEPLDGGFADLLQHHRRPLDADLMIADTPGAMLGCRLRSAHTMSTL